MKESKGVAKLKVFNDHVIRFVHSTIGGCVIFANSPADYARHQTTGRACAIGVGAGLQFHSTSVYWEYLISGGEGFPCHSLIRHLGEHVLSGDLIIRRDVKSDFHESLAACFSFKQSTGFSPDLRSLKDYTTLSKYTFIFGIPNELLGLLYRYNIGAI